jgi:hypothetical protein
MQNLFVFLDSRQNYSVGFEVRTAVFMKSTIFWDITPVVRRVSTDVSEAICSSETSVDTQRTTRRYIPKDCMYSSELFWVFFLEYVLLLGSCILR